MGSSGLTEFLDDEEARRRGSRKFSKFRVTPTHTPLTRSPRRVSYFVYLRKSDLPILGRAPPQDDELQKGEMCAGTVIFWSFQPEVRRLHRACNPRIVICTWSNITLPSPPPSVYDKINAVREASHLSVKPSCVAPAFLPYLSSHPYPPRCLSRFPAPSLSYDRV